MTDQTTDEAAVEQRDRDAAANLLRWAFQGQGVTDLLADKIEAGEADEYPFTLAFAKHRLVERQRAERTEKLLAEARALIAQCAHCGAIAAYDQAIESFDALRTPSTGEQG